jgi:hypothetical protein
MPTSSPALSASERQQRYRAGRKLRSIDVSEETVEAIAALRTFTGWNTDKAVATAVKYCLSSQRDERVSGHTASVVAEQRDATPCRFVTPTTVSPDEASPGDAIEPKPVASRRRNTSGLRRAKDKTSLAGPLLTGWSEPDQGRRERPSSMPVAIVTR